MSNILHFLWKPISSESSNSWSLPLHLFWRVESHHICQQMVSGIQVHCAERQSHDMTNRKQVTLYIFSKGIEYLITSSSTNRKQVILHIGLKGNLIRVFQQLVITIAPFLKGWISSHSNRKWVTLHIADRQSHSMANRKQVTLYIFLIGNLITSSNRK